MSERLPHANGNPSEIGKRSRGEIATELASGDTREWYARFWHDLRLQPADIANEEHLSVVAITQLARNRQRGIDVTTGAAA
jgi:hypothetical protein